MKKAMQTSLDAGALGIKVQVSGCIGGAEIARTEWYKEGSTLLHTLRADIDFANGRAETTYGSIGVKARSTAVKKTLSRGRLPSHAIDA